MTGKLFMCNCIAKVYTPSACRNCQVNKSWPGYHIPYQLRITDHPDREDPNKNVRAKETRTFYQVVELKTGIVKTFAEQKGISEYYGYTKPQVQYFLSIGHSTDKKLEIKAFTVDKLGNQVENKS